MPLSASLFKSGSSLGCTSFPYQCEFKFLEFSHSLSPNTRLYRDRCVLKFSSLSVLQGYFPRQLSLFPMSLKVQVLLQIYFSQQFLKFYSHFHPTFHPTFSPNFLPTLSPHFLYPL